MEEQARFYNERENAIEWLEGSKTMTVTISNRKIANRIRKLKEQHPDEVEIIADGPENGGYLYARIPAGWIFLGPRPKRELTDEQLEALRETFAKNVLNKSSEPR